MIEPSIDMDISVVALTVMCQELIQATKLDPIGLILGVGAASNIGEILGSCRQWKGLRVDVITAMPFDTWIVYNTTNFIVQGI